MELLQFVRQAVPTRIGRYLDVGTGSGVLVSALTDPQSWAIGAEINPRAARVARLNVELNQRSCEIWEGDIFHSALGRFDLITWSARFISPGRARRQRRRLRRSMGDRGHIAVYRPSAHAPHRAGTRISPDGDTHPPRWQQQTSGCPVPPDLATAPRHRSTPRRVVLLSLAQGLSPSTRHSTFPESGFGDSAWPRARDVVRARYRWRVRGPFAAGEGLVGRA